MSDNNRRWQQPAQQYNQAYNQQYYPQQDGNYSRAATDSVQEAQGLLAVYPMASANPTNHVARHLSSMSLTAEPPTFAQPNYYSVQNGGYTQGNPPPPYTEYVQELAYMDSHNPAATQSGYWTNTRDNAVQMLNSSNGPAYSYQTPQHWDSQPVQHSSYSTSPFAQSLFQRTTPQAAYPTPPPPSISLSSSSLAYALGPPPPPQPPKVHKPQESPAFFNDFLQQKTREMNASRQAVAPPSPLTPQKPPKIVTPVIGESPDPLAIQPSSSTVPSVTPSRKRKVVVELESPAIKRIHSSQSLKPPSKPNSMPQTPKHNRINAPRSPGSQRMAYVAVPYKPWLTTPRKGDSGPSEKALGKMKIDDSVEDDDDLGGFGEDDSYSPMKVDMVKGSARRTGDRDERPPLEKFISLVEDIFETEDSLPADVDLSDLPVEFFSHTTTVDASRPVLHPNVVQKLLKSIGHVARPTKRLRTVAGMQATPRTKGRMAEVDTQMLSRLLKTLERSVKAGEDIDPFPRSAADQTVSSNTGVRMESASPSKKSPKKAARGKKGDKPSTPMEDGDNAGDTQESGAPAELSDADHDKLARALETGRDSVNAADCCIALLVSDRLTKQLYSEELITACLSSIKNQLTKIIYPFVEAYTEISTGSTGSHLNPALYYLLTDNSPTCQANRRQLSEIFQALSSVIPRVNNMVNVESVAMSDAIIIQAVYIAIGPFFVVEGTGAEADGGGGRGKKSGGSENVILKTFGKSAMRGLRLDALALIRSIFANHEDQRSWIIEEILSSLIKLSDSKQKAGQFRLRDGRSIRTVSALLLQLVQTSAHDARVEARRIDKARQNKFALKRQESLTESQLNNGADEPFLDEIDQEEIRLYSSGLDSATKAAKTIVLFLTQRSGKGKATKNSNEAEYRTIFDNLIADVLVVLFWPEWPAASLLLSVACKYMVSSLDDVKTNQTDNNAAKSIALDHLGVIASRIRSSTLNVQSDTNKYQAVKCLDEIVASANAKGFSKLVKIHKDIAAHLCKRSSEDQAYDSAREFTAATLGHELAASLKQLDSWVTDPSGDDDLNIKDTSQLQSFGYRLKDALQGVWKEPTADVFDIGSQEEVARIDRLAEEIGTIQSLRNSFQPILTIILMALDAPAIFMRTKALKALGQIITSDATILSAPNVRRAIESHLLDSSPAVRDAAVELIGKYMIDSPKVAGDYYQKIADRIADTGLGVRKRVIKLLKSYYGVIDDSTRQIDIATRVVLRMLDDDETVRELAIKTIEELWFPNNIPPPTAKPISSNSAAKVNEKAALLNKVTVIMGTSATFKDRQSPLEDLLHKIMMEKSGNEAAFLHARYGEICEALIDGLVDASDLPGFTVINCVRTIYLFTSAHPAILSGSRASTLLPYLMNAASPEDQSTTDYLLKIFRISIPCMPKTAAKFGQELQLALQPMVLKPTGGNVQMLQEAVACMCIVIQNLTHDFPRLINLLKSCNVRLQQTLKRPPSQQLPPAEVRGLSILAFLVSLLGEHCNFDEIRRDRTDLAKDIDSISQGSIIEHIYLSVLALYHKYNSPALRARLLQCLGFLFRAQPTLMVMEQSSKIMDEIFASPEEEARGRLLRILQEFLVSEASKHATKEKESGKAKPKAAGVNMEELVGNTDGFADSGVSSAVVQRYLSQILEAALSLQPQIQATAIDVLTFTIKQGLAHPLQSFPVIVALETSPVASLCNRASALHTILHTKHASLLNARYTLSARASFNYQKKIASGFFQGYRVQTVPVALLQRWYSLVREKRQTRQDFLKSLVKVFQECANQQASQDDIDFVRYMAENFSAFDYKTHEEVITVIKHLTAVLSTIGVQLLETISPSHLLSHLQTTSAPNPHQDSMDVVPETPATATTNLTDQIPLMRNSVIIAIVMLLKSYLKALYSLSEDKCNKFVLGKKSAAGDKPAARRHDKPIEWDRLPFATAPILTSDDVTVQKRTFLDIWNEDGVTEEPEEEFN